MTRWVLALVFSNRMNLCIVISACHKVVGLVHKAQKSTSRP
jgi:hypothetical protein